MRRTITTDPVDIKRVTKKYYGPFHAHKFDNLDEMDKFLLKRLGAKTHTWRK